MTVVSTLDIGAVSTSPVNFNAARSAPSSVHGLKEVTFSGVLPTTDADTLDELVSNPAARITKAGVSGVLEYVVASSPALPSYTGYYILQSFDSSPDGIDPNWPYVNFTLKAVLIGDVA